MGEVEIGLGRHARVFAVDSASGHDAQHMGAVEGDVGVVGVSVGGNLFGRGHGVAFGAVVVIPTEIIIVSRARLSFVVEESGVGEVVAIVEDACCHTLPCEGLWQSLAGIDGCGVNLAGGDVHRRPWHGLSLDALDALVGRQGGELAAGHVDDEDAPDAVDHAAAVAGEQSRRLVSVAEGEEGEDALVAQGGLLAGGHPFQRGRQFGKRCGLLGVTEVGAHEQGDAEDQRRFHVSFVYLILAANIRQKV